MKSFAASLLFLACLFAGGRDARACTCAGFTLAEQLTSADYAFAGTVVGVDTVDWVREGGVYPEGLQVATVRVEQVWKGDVAGQFEVSTMIVGSCRYPLAMGAKYVLYAYAPDAWSPNHVYTGLCTRSARYADAAADLAALGAGYAPVAAEGGAAVPAVLSLEGVFPNPASSHVVLSFELAQPGDVALAVYDLLGREVAAVAAGYHAAGRHVVRWDAGRAPAGHYLCRLRGGGRTVTRRVVVAR